MSNIIYTKLIDILFHSTQKILYNFNYEEPKLNPFNDIVFLNHNNFIGANLCQN